MPFFFFENKVFDPLSKTKSIDKLKNDFLNNKKYISFGLVTIKADDTKYKTKYQKSMH